MFRLASIAFAATVGFVATSVAADSRIGVTVNPANTSWTLTSTSDESAVALATDIRAALAVGLPHMFGEGTLAGGTADNVGGNRFMVANTEIEVKTAEGGLTPELWRDLHIAVLDAVLFAVYQDGLPAAGDQLAGETTAVVGPDDVRFRCEVFLQGLTLDIDYDLLPEILSLGIAEHDKQLVVEALPMLDIYTLVLAPQSAMKIYTPDSLNAILIFGCGVEAYLKGLAQN